MRAIIGFKYQHTQAAKLEILASKGFLVGTTTNGNIIGIKRGLIRGQKADYSPKYFKTDGEYIKSLNSEKIIDTIAR